MSNGQNKEGFPSPELETGQTFSKPVVSVQLRITDEELTGGPEGLTGEDLKAILKWALLQAREEAAAHQKEDSDHEHAEGHMHEHEYTRKEELDQEQQATHVHGHTHPNSKAVSNRLAKAIGHLESVKRMVDRGDDCSDILIQLAAVRSAINNAGKVLLIDHLNHCIVDAVEDGDLNAIDDFSDAIWKFVK